METEWETIFASYTSDKDLEPKYTESSKILNSQMINDLMKKWTNELNRTFSEEEVQMAKRHKKNCSPFLFIQEMQMKTTLGFYLTC
jgi:hypothetical protein